MRKLVLLILLVAICLVLFACGGDDNDDSDFSCDGVIVFPDKAFDDVIRCIIHKTDEDIYSEDLDDITVINGFHSMDADQDYDEEQICVMNALIDRDIYNITGIQCFVNLAVLDLNGSNQISDITPLSELTNLEYLNVRDNRISDLSPLVVNTGLGSEDQLFIDDNIYDCEDPDVLSDIAELESRGFAVFEHDCE